MLPIIIPSSEVWDEEREEFVYVKEQTIMLEHSLVSLQKWEAKWKIPFLDNKQKTHEQYIDYIRCMTISPKVDPNTYRFLSAQNILEIDQYIGDSMTATWFSKDKKKKSGKQRAVTAELIYYWMIAFNIPYECRKWHLNQLLALIEVCEEESKQPEKKSRKQNLDYTRALNQARRKAHKKR